MINYKVNMKYLVTGSCGFIGSNLCKRLLEDKNNIVVGIDNINDYYSIDLKEYRLNELKEHSNFKFYKEDISEKDKIFEIFKKEKFDVVINLAAQAGVRYSITNPDSYIKSNVMGFYNILEACRNYPVKHLVYASSSSVYGNNEKIPYSVDSKVDCPVSLYAATKKSNELFAYCYSKLYNIPTTGLRFFTVYGPAGRPDMAYFSFTNKLINGEKIKIFNYGNCKRDFTYIDDIVEGCIRVINNPPKNEVPYKVYNIGSGNPQNLLDFVNILQKELVLNGILPSNYDFDSHMELVPMQPGDVEITYADTKDLERDFNYKPQTTFETGIKNFVKWYKEYYKK